MKLCRICFCHQYQALKKCHFSFSKSRKNGFQSSGHLVDEVKLIANTFGCKSGTVSVHIVRLFQFLKYMTEAPIANSTKALPN